MQLRDDGGGKTIEYPNMWNFPGGGVEGNETPVETAAREIEEETNISLHPAQLTQIFAYQHDGTTQDYVFVCEVPEDTVAEVLEGAAMEWLSFEEIARLELAFEQDKILPSLKDYLNSL